MSDNSLSIFLGKVEQIVGPENLTIDEEQRRSKSKDCYHFSPVLIPQLDGCFADIIARPRNEDQLKNLIGCAAAHRVPITPRGGGTGNYGQGVPLQGGVMISTEHLDSIIELSSSEARVQAGVILQNIEKAAFDLNAELRCFPSTVPTSHTGGFITGGSGGVGSIKWGMLRESDNVRHARIITVEEEPRVIDLERSELGGVLHNCGLTCFVSEVTLSLSQRVPWQQYIVEFDDFYLALSAAEHLAHMDDIQKRLLTVFEWPIPSYFVPLVKKAAIPKGSSTIFLYTDRNPEAVAHMMAGLGGRISFHEPPKKDAKRGTQIYDYTWNHTTQWAMKADSQLTYLQDRFLAEPGLAAEQIKARKEKFPEVSEHVEYIKDAGTVVPGGLSIVRFQSKERLWELIEWCEANEIRVANPHTHYLDEDTRWYGDEHLARKREWDPFGLLNPGHLRVLEDGATDDAR